MSVYGTGRWLTKNQYQRIRYKAKKMGACDVCLNVIWHFVNFGYTSVTFAFRPFQCHASIRDGNLWTGHFSDLEGAERIKANMDKALEFMDYLREFNCEIEKDGAS